MTVRIIIRHVPKRVRDELASQAEERGQSMQEFLRGELERLATDSSLKSWLERVRERKQITGTRLSARQILRHRDADRKYSLPS